MKTLIVSSTAREIRPLLNGLGTTGMPSGTEIQLNDNVHVLITGVGTVAMTWAVSRITKPYDLVVNAGICGSFNDGPEIKSLVQIQSDRFGTLGVMEKGEFKSVFELGLADENQFPYKNGWLNGSYHIENLKSVKGITSDILITDIRVIDLISSKWNVSTESMEGAAFFFSCRKNGLPCIQLRSVSNRIGERDKDKWDIDGAVEVLCDGLVNHLNLEL